MTKTRTIGIFSRIFEGNLSGGILRRVHKIARQHNIKLIAVRTMSENLYTYPLALDLVDGWLIINDPISDQLLLEIHQRGQPIVGINRAITCIPCPTVLPNNNEGMYIAVKHLIVNGHRTLAFIGQLTSLAIKERLLGYKRALDEYGIHYNPDLIYDTNNMYYKGGHDVAIQLIDQGMPCTAIVAGTDLNAMGLIEKLRESGYRTPEDIAIVSFDNLSYANSYDPPLSTVNLPVGEMAEIATNLLLKMIAGESVPPTMHIVECEFIPRQSCGIIPAIPRVEAPQASLKEDNPKFIKHLTEMYHHTGIDLIRANSVSIREFSWLANIYWGCLAIWKQDEAERLHLQIEQFFNRKEDPLPSFLGQVYPAEAFPPAAIMPQNAQSNIDDITILNIIRTENREWGVIAFIGPTITDPIRYWFGINTMCHFFDLIATSLEREELFKQLLIREKRSRDLAEQLSTVSRATNEMVWEWNLETDEMTWNSDRISEILGLPEKKLNSTLDLFFQRIHPDDLPGIHLLLEKHLQMNEPFQAEFRLRREDDNYLWFYAAGEVIHNLHKTPIKIVGSLRDITERKHAEEQITHLAYHDVLTGLPNRLLFQDRLHNALRQTTRLQRKMAVLLFDLDRFKLINDSYGHQIGDQLLVTVTNHLKTQIPDWITLARLGGDEFILLMPDITEDEEALTFGRHILALLNAPFVFDQYEFYVTASLGVAIYPSGGEDKSALIKNADIAMYRAKAKGRNQMEVYLSGMNSHAMEWLQLEGSLRKAFDRKEFELYFQPQIDIQTGNVYGAEALLRWNSPDQGVVGPAHFIPWAEESGFIVPIGNWVLREACLQMIIWQQKGLPSLKISVNISSKQFEQIDFVEQIKSVLQETGLNPSLLCLEITESWAIEHMELCTSMLAELIQLGISISLDDFGTGYSSLALLKRLPIHEVKIDKSFVQNLLTDSSDAAIVRAIIAMSHSLNMKVVAEGVETVEQLAIVKEFECDFFQGYLYSKPIPAAVFEHLLKVKE